jgi:hypothetical protein
MSSDSLAYVSWVTQQMSGRRDDFIAGLVRTTRSEIQSLDHDARMVDLLHASTRPPMPFVIGHYRWSVRRGPADAPQRLSA